MNNVKKERRESARIPADTLQQAEVSSDNVDVNIVPVNNNYDLSASLRDIHQNGMCFFLSEHVLAEDDIIHIDTMLGDFNFETDAIVRWIMGSYVGVEFVDSRARNAALLAELYTEKLLRYVNEQDH